MWPTKRRVVAPVESSQSRRVLSHDAERAYAPSEEITCPMLSPSHSNSHFLINIRSLKQCESGRGDFALGIRSSARRE